MNQNPQSNGGQNSSGGFKVNIDQRDLMASSAEAKRRRWENQNLAEQPASSPKRSSLTEKERKAEKKAHKKRNRVKARKNKRVFSFVWLCMVLLEKAHIGEVQASVWDQDTTEICKKAGVELL